MTYTKLAPYYDLLGWADFTDYLWPHLQSFLTNHGNPECFLDIACGTGVLTERLTSLGIPVRGIDISPEMILKARSKPYSAPTEFSVGDMRDFRLGTEYEVCGCFYDSINHITDSGGVVKAFECAYRHTKPDGYYLFDVNTIRGLAGWKPFHSFRRGQFYIKQYGRYNRKTRLGEYKVEAFVRNESGEVEYIEQILPERGYTVSFLKMSLARVGFSRILIRPFRSEETVSNAERLLFICRR